MSEDFKFPTELRISTSIGISIVIGGLLNSGMMYQQFQQLKDDIKVNANQISMVRENQINELAANGQIKAEVSMQAGRIDRIDKRLLTVESNLMTRGGK